MKHEESNIQTACVKWFRYQYPELAKLLIAIPNGGFRNQITAAIMKAEGVVAGAADLVLFVPKLSEGCGALCIEMKTPKGTQSELQKEWQLAVEAQGYKYVLCRSVYEFACVVNGYLKN